MFIKFSINKGMIHLALQINKLNRKEKDVYFEKEAREK